MELQSHSASVPQRSILGQDSLNEEDPKERLGKLLYGKALKAGAGSQEQKVPFYNLLRHIQTATASLLASVEVSNKSQAAIELEVGQLFTKGSTVPRRYQCNQNRPSEPFAREEWASVFTSHTDGGKASTIFSPKLTTSWEDADYITNLPHPTRRHIFDSTVKRDVSTYKIMCLNERTGDQGYIEISNDGAPPRISPMSQELGAINIHFPRHIWDARIRVTSPSALGSEASSQLRAIAENVWIHAVDSLNPSQEVLYCQNPHSHISVVSAELRREIVHQARGTGRDIFGHLVRVESLEIAELVGGFCAFSREEATRPSAYWEFKLSSKDMSNTFGRRQSREIKGFSYWAQSQPLMSSLEFLIGCADLVVCNINDVGHTSRKRLGISASATKTSTRKARSAVSDSLRATGGG